MKFLKAPFIFIYRLFHYTLMGFLSVFYFIYSIILAIVTLILNIFLKPFKKKSKLDDTIIDKKELKKQKKEELSKKKKEKEEELKKQKEKNVYINEDVKIEKKKISSYINDFFKLLADIPKRIKTYFKDKYNNSAFVKNKKNKEEIHREALLISFEGEDADKSDKKRVYEYVGKNPDGKLVKGYFEAFSKVEVHSFLLSEGFEIYSIRTSKLLQFLHGSTNKSKVKFKVKDLIFFLTQLSTYIKSGITLVESLRILSHQYKDKKYQKIFRNLIYDLTMGDNFSDALLKQGETFPKLLINMIKASEMTGELPEALDDMADYYTQTDKTRKQMITAMTYPALIMSIAIAVVVFILLYVIPKFVSIYNSLDSDSIPKFTLIVLATSEFLKANFLTIVIWIVIIVVIFIYLYKNVDIFRSMVQWLLMHMPVFGNIMIYNEITIFSKTFSSLLRHNVFITDSMEILTKMTNNEIYKMIMLDTITNLAKGEKISLAFKDHWAVPIPAYEMIVTGERTGQLSEMLQKVSDYYQEMHVNSVSRLKTFIEPILLIFLTVVVGIIVMSIVIPMFNLYSSFS